MNDRDRSLMSAMSAAAQAEEDDDTYLPPRKTVHPSEQGKWTNAFYLTLLWLFIGLVIGLTIWGIRYY